jgi:hypothetical protein
MRRVSKKIQQREQLVLALLQQPTLEKAAAAAGISATTAWRISKTPEFQQEQQRARRKVYEHSLDRLLYGSSAAVTTILGVMADPEAAAGSRLRAADSVMNHAAKATALEDLTARVDQLERLMMLEKEALPCRT